MSIEQLFIQFSSSRIRTFCFGSPLRCRCYCLASYIFTLGKRKRIIINFGYSYKQS